MLIVPALLWTKNYFEGILTFLRAFSHMFSERFLGHQYPCQPCQLDSRINCIFYHPPPPLILLSPIPLTHAHMHTLPAQKLHLFLLPLMSSLYIFFPSWPFFTSSKTICHIFILETKKIRRKKTNTTAQESTLTWRRVFLIAGRHGG